jgi:nucleoside-diphosphate-sugar epimerase
MKVAIIGCGLVGMEAAHHLKRAGHEVTGTTTRESRVAEIGEVLDHVVVLQGSDYDGLRTLLEDKDVVIVSVSGGMFAQAGKGTLRDPDRYKNIYIDTTTALNQVLETNRSVRQVIYTSAETVYAGVATAPIVETVELPGHHDDPATEIFVRTEEIVSRARRPGRNVCIFRLAIVYGKRFSMELMIDLAKKGPVPFSGDCVHQAVLDTGFQFEITTPDFKEPGEDTRLGIEACCKRWAVGACPPLSKSAAPLNTPARSRVTRPSKPSSAS